MKLWQKLFGKREKVYGPKLTALKNLLPSARLETNRRGCGELLYHITFKDVPGTSALSFQYEAMFNRWTGFMDFWLEGHLLFHTWSRDHFYYEVLELVKERFDLDKPAMEFKVIYDAEKLEADEKERATLAKYGGS